MDLKFQTKISAGGTKAMVKEIAEIWRKSHVVAFFVILVLFIGAGFYYWKQNIINPDWSQERKQEYLQAQNTAVVFKESDFEKALEDINSRKSKTTNTSLQLKDVFVQYR